MESLLVVDDRPDVAEIGRLMLLRGIHRRERRGGQWVDVPDWSGLAKRAGLDPSTVYYLRDNRGSPRLVTIGAIARALGVKVRDLLLDVDDAGPVP